MPVGSDFEQALRQAAGLLFAQADVAHHEAAKAVGLDQEINLYAENMTTH